MNEPDSPSFDSDLNKLAIHGGRPACGLAPLQWPLDDDDVLGALNFCYADRSWGKYDGPNCEIFKQQLADYHDVEFVTLCQSGTFATELALRGLRIGSGDEVIMAGYDFPGNFAAIESVGAKPVLIDVAENNWNFDPRLVQEARSNRTKALIVSHLHGGVGPMRDLRNYCDENELAIIEDACQMPGGIVEGRTAGTWGDAGILSFGGSKLLTAGRGGAVITSREEVYQRMKLYANRGNDAFPLSELQAAVLRPQMGKLDKQNAKRHASVQRLAPRIDKMPGLRMLKNYVRKTVPGYYKLGLRYVPDELGGLSREEFIAVVQAEGVPLDAGFRGFAKRSDRRCRKVGALKQTRAAGRSMLVLHHPVLLEEPEIIDQLAFALEKVTAVFASSEHAPEDDEYSADDIDKSASGEEPAA